MGILKAIDSFNHNKNTKFTTHAYWQVKGEISHEFMRRETDKRKANYCTVSFATPIFGEGESEDKTLKTCSMRRQMNLTTSMKQEAKTYGGHTLN